MRHLILLLLGSVFLTAVLPAAASPRSPDPADWAGPAPCRKGSDSQESLRCLQRLHLQGRISGPDLLLSWPGGESDQYAIYYNFPD